MPLLPKADADVPFEPNGAIVPGEKSPSRSPRTPGSQTNTKFLSDIPVRSITNQELIKYNRESFAGSVASSKVFEYSTLFIIFLNAIWLGIDTDLNHATSVHDTDVGFLIVENFFCAYFMGELIVRWLAFKVKTEALTDGWFVFDSLLVTLMICETWILPLALARGKGNPLEDFGALRLLRLLRLSRLIRLMRSFPELLTIVKGIAAATRSVASVLLFLTILDYVFAIVFTGTYQKKPSSKDDPEACDNWEAEGGAEFARACLTETFFGNLGYSMFTLLCNGTLLDDVAPLVKALREDSVIMLSLFFLFIVLSSFTVLNMLIGILCEVVEKTGHEEKEKLKRDNLKDVITHAFRIIDTDGSNRISKAEFDTMCADRSVLNTLEEELGIDGARFVEMRQLLFTDGHGERELTFEAFLKLLIRLRPEEQASTMDVQQFRKMIREQEITMSRQCEKLNRQVQVCRRVASEGADRFQDVASESTCRGCDTTTIGAGAPADGIGANSGTSADHARLVAEATDAELMQELRKRFQQETLPSSLNVRPSE